ncbi:hypothetical protein P691DRAFT_804366 [Macrolepiota fuliginosa MF-IS2]|uniref:Uncharacterized protein n=1 Tax=Macrolepiota fuliginosa MF-IS2 TaxID=1400762 RepID=A0A9P6C2H0_9AGAR|nr:hypothetical protein P691DRAFT_804366 [Macrolepiota fuliginosa MF-IS2]
MKLQEAETDGFLKDYQRLHTEQRDAYIQWHQRAGTFTRSLGQQRSTAVDDASKMLNVAAIERETALRSFLKNARSQVEQSKEQEKVVTFRSV